MTIKSILCIFGGSHRETNLLDEAFSLAQKHNAHVSFLHISPDPSEFAFGYREDVVTMAPVMDSLRKENENRMRSAKKMVLSTAEKYQVLPGVLGLNPERASMEFRYIIGPGDEVVAREGRLCDLILISQRQTGADGLYQRTTTSALFNTGQPVMIFPEKEGKQDTIEGKTIALAWNGSQEAARAMHQSMQFMQTAKKVYILIAWPDNKESGEKLMPDSLVNYLTSHNIKSELVMIDLSHHQNLEETLLKQAQILNTDILVMGAYGHSRFREMIFGGMTEFMLEKADMPVLLTH